MTNAELISKIKTEIERLKGIGGIVPLDNREQKTGYESALNDIEIFLDSLESEKPNQERLEKEINRYLEPIHTADIQFEPFTQMTKCARHFAQWGYLRAVEKYNEIEYNRQRAEEEIPKDLEEAAKKEYPCDKSWMTPDMLDLNAHKQVAFRKGAKWKESQPDQLPSDLNGAAIDFADNARKELFAKDYAISSIADYDHGCIDGFIAGAKWQYQKDRGKFAQIKAKTWCEGFDACKEQMPLPEDTVLFNKGVAEGKRLMMEEAVEGEVVLNPYPTICLDDCKDYDFKDGDKVRVIVLPKED